MTTTPDPTVPTGDDALISELVETLEVWALVAPPTPTVDPAASRRPERHRRVVALAAAAAVASLTVGAAVALHAHDGRGGAPAGRTHDCGAAAVARSDGPPVLELRLVAPARVTSGSTITVQLLARSLDGRPHEVVTGLRPDLTWVRQGRILGSDTGPRADVGLSHQVAADGTWTPFTWAAGRGTAVREVVGGCTQGVDGGGRRDPLAPGEYDLVAAMTTLRGGSGDQDATYVSPPVRVEVVAPSAGKGRGGQEAPPVLSSTALAALSGRGCGPRVRDTFRPPAVEVELMAPRTAVSGSTLPVRMRARSLDGRPHELTAAVADPDYAWVRDGRVAGRFTGAIAGIGHDQPVPADGSWVTLTWPHLSRSTAPPAEVKGCSRPLHDEDTVQDPLSPGRYDLVALFLDQVHGGPFTWLVSSPTTVDVVAP